MFDACEISGSNNNLKSLNKSTHSQIPLNLSQSNNSQTRINPPESERNDLNKEQQSNNSTQTFRYLANNSLIFDKRRLNMAPLAAEKRAVNDKKIDVTYKVVETINVSGSNELKNNFLELNLYINELTMCDDQVDQLTKALNHVIVNDASLMEMRINPELSEECRESVLRVLQKHENVFVKHQYDVGLMRDCECVTQIPIQLRLHKI